jgi:hypothetical protein
LALPDLDPKAVRLDPIQPFLERAGAHLDLGERITGLSRNTVAKWLPGEVDGQPKYRRSE